LSTVEKVTELVGRFLISLIFLLSGIGKVSGFESTQTYMESVDVPGLFLVPAILVEIVGAIAVIIGWKTRPAAVALAGFCFVSAVLFHFNTGDTNEMINFMKNFAMAGGLLVIAVRGAGPWSIDGRVRILRPPAHHAGVS
jgi:putative oxidoreductase